MIRVAKHRVFAGQQGTMQGLIKERDRRNSTWYFFCRKASYPTGEDAVPKNKYIRRGKNSIGGNPSLPKARRKGTHILTCGDQEPFYEKVMGLLLREDGECMD